MLPQLFFYHTWFSEAKLSRNWAWGPKIYVSVHRASKYHTSYSVGWTFSLLYAVPVFYTYYNCLSWLCVAAAVASPKNTSRTKRLCVSQRLSAVCPCASLFSAAVASRCRCRRAGKHPTGALPNRFTPVMCVM